MKPIDYEPLAGSMYFDILLFALLAYPFLLVAINMFVYDVKAKDRYSKWFNRGYLTCALLLIALHMQTEEVYGRHLLNEWYETHPEDRPEK